MTYPIRNFSKGTPVRFTTSSGTWNGEFLRKVGMGKGGMHYKIQVGSSEIATVFAQSTKIEKV